MDPGKPPHPAEGLCPLCAPPRRQCTAAHLSLQACSDSQGQHSKVRAWSFSRERHVCLYNACIGIYLQTIKFIILKCVSVFHYIHRIVQLSQSLRSSSHPHIYCVWPPRVPSQEYATFSKLSLNIHSVDFLLKFSV